MPAPDKSEYGATDHFNGPDKPAYSFTSLKNGDCSSLDSACLASKPLSAFRDHRPSEQLLVPVYESELLAKLDRYFEVTSRGSTMQVELRAGVLDFFANSYLLVLVPEMLGRAGVPHCSAYTGFIITTAFTTLMIGFLAKLPIPAGPGVGCATFFAYSLSTELQKNAPASSDGFSMLVLEQATTTCFVAALVMLLLALWNLPMRVFNLVPASVKNAMPPGLGLLLALVGFQQVGLVVSNPQTGLSIGNCFNPTVMVGLSGCFIMAFLERRQVKAAFIGSLFLLTAISWLTHLAPLPPCFFAWPNFSNFCSYISLEGLAMSTVLLRFIVAIYVICLFDIAGITYSCCQQAGLLAYDKSIPGVYWVFVACGIGSLIASGFGCSSSIVFAESFAGILVGGRTGLTAVICACCFLLALPFAPVMEAVPLFASAPVLVMLGVNLLGLARYLNWDDIEDSLPSFFTVALMPFCYSIEKALALGFGAHLVLEAMECVAHPREVFAVCARSIHMLFSWCESCKRAKPPLSLPRAQSFQEIAREGSVYSLALQDQVNSSHLLQCRPALQKLFEQTASRRVQQRQQQQQQEWSQAKANGKYSPSATSAGKRAEHSVFTLSPVNNSRLDAHGLYELCNQLGMPLASLEQAQQVIVREAGKSVDDEAYTHDWTLEGDEQLDGLGWEGKEEGEVSEEEEIEVEMEESILGPAASPTERGSLLPHTARRRGKKATELSRPVAAQTINYATFEHWWWFRHQGLGALEKVSNRGMSPRGISASPRVALRQRSNIT
eukprot:g15523.t1